MEQDFLSFLRRKPSSFTKMDVMDDSMPVEQFFYRIAEDAAGFAGVDIVGVDGKPVEPDARNFSGDEGVLLRTIQKLRENQMLSISWGEENPDSIRLSTYPYLVYQLIRCRNLVDKDMRKIEVSDAPAVLRLELSLRDDNISVDPAWSLDIPADDDSADNKVTRDFLPLNDSFVLAEGIIHPVRPIGDCFDRLKFFLSPFATDMVELFLSVVYSNIDNFTLVWDNYDVRRLTSPVVEQRAVIFEKVDADLGLHVRVSTILPGMTEEAVRNFDLTRLVSIDSDSRRISVAPIQRADIEAASREVAQMIREAAPSRREARDLYHADNYFIIPENLASPFLLTCLPKLLESFAVLGTDKLKDYKVTPVKPKLNFRYQSGIDFLEGDATVTVGNDIITLGQLFEQYRRNRYVKLSDGNRAVIDGDYIRRLERIFGDKKNAGKDIRVTYLDLPEIEDMLSTRLDPQFFERQRKVFEGFNSLSDETLSLPALRATLRPYQEEGVKWIDYLYKNNMGGCLADDMGLGKTVQTIAMLSRIYPGEKLPSMIVMPRSLLFNWENELSRFAPGITYHTYYGQTRNFKEALKADVILTTYAIVRNDINKLKEKEFHYVILDESQNIKNLEAQTTRAVFLLNAAHRLALSGTPIENNLSELYSLFRFLNPGMFGDIDDFNRRYAIPIQRDDDKEATQALRRRIFPFMLRRLKKDVLKELPDRIEQTLYVEMSQEQAEYYEQRRRVFKEKVDETVAKDGINKAQFVMFQALTELRRIASVPESLTDERIKSPKLEMLVDNLLEATANGHKCVVFFTYIAGLELTGEALEANGIGYETMTGATHNRRDVITRFNTDPDCRVLLMTLKTGGVGLNLTVADTVFIFEPWWNKAAEEQAINRLHRMGQKAKVHSYSLITRDTIEEKIRKLQEQKAELFNALIEADATTGKHLSQEDIDFILGK